MSFLQELREIQPHSFFNLLPIDVQFLPFSRFLFFHVQRKQRAMADYPQVMTHSVASNYK